MNCRLLTFYFLSVSTFRVSHEGLWSTWGKFVWKIIHTWQIYTVFSRQFFDNAAFSLMFIFGVFVENQLSVCKYTHVWFFYFVPLIYACLFLFLTINIMFFITMTLQYSLKSAVIIPQALFLSNVYTIDLSVQTVLWFHWSLRMILYFPVNCFQNFDCCCTESTNRFWEEEISIILIY